MRTSGPPRRKIKRRIKSAQLTSGGGMRRRKFATSILKVPQIVIIIVIVKKRALVMAYTYAQMVMLIPIAHWTSSICQAHAGKLEPTSAHRPRHQFLYRQRDMDVKQPTAGIPTNMGAVRKLQKYFSGLSKALILPSHDWTVAERVSKKSSSNHPFPVVASTVCC